jgi:hypothetical protein
MPRDKDGALTRRRWAAIENRTQSHRISREIREKSRAFDASEACVQYARMLRRCHATGSRVYSEVTLRLAHQDGEAGAKRAKLVPQIEHGGTVCGRDRARREKCYEYEKQRWS